MKRISIALSILIVGAILFIIIYGLFLLESSASPDENLIGIKNAGNQPIYNITITIENYSEKIVEIPPKEMHNVYLPDLGYAERDIKLAYFVNGESKAWSGGYAESNYCAYITITNDNSVSIRHLNSRQCLGF